MAKNQVTLTFAGDAGSLIKAAEKSSAATKDLGKDFDRLGGDAKSLGKNFNNAADDAKEAGRAIDKAGEAADHSEKGFMGTADVLDGLGAAFGLPTEAATGLMRGFGDLTGGMATLSPMVGGLGTAMSGLALGPVALIAAGVAGLVAILVIAYKNCETFRDIVKAAFEKVEAVVGPVINVVSRAFSGWMSLFSGGSKETQKALDEMAETNRKAMERMQADYEKNSSAYDTWVGTVRSGFEALLAPTQKFEVDTANTLTAVQTNLASNIAVWENWQKNLTTLVSRGFSDVAKNLQQMGPAWAMAAEEAAGATDRKLQEIRRLFTVAGDRSGIEFAGAFAGAIEKSPLVPWLAPGSTGAQLMSQFLGPMGAGISKGFMMPSHRAAGGPVAAGAPYIVGENGPELFMSSRSGSIIPNGGVATGGGSAVINVYGPVLGSDEASIARYLSDILARETRRSG